MRDNKCVSVSVMQYSLLVLFLSSHSQAQELSEESLERWLESDDQALPYERKGGGEVLQFLHPPPDYPVPFSHTRLELTEASRKNGWVWVKQCHTGLDPVPDAEVVYHFRQMRNLRVSEAVKIEQHWIEGQSVQMKNIGRGARLCVELEARILHQAKNGNYHLRYGPFQRRFFDSYFPMHVLLEVDYAQSRLAYESITPAATKGFVVTEEGRRLLIDAWFRGKLTVALGFHAETQP